MVASGSLFEGKLAGTWSWSSHLHLENLLGSSRATFLHSTSAFTESRGMVLGLR